MKDAGVYTLDNKYDKMTKDEIELTIKYYISKIDKVCKELINSLDGRIVNKICQARQYYRTYIQNKERGKDINSLGNKAWKLRTEVLEEKEYKRKSREVWSKYITEREFTPYFNTYFIVEYVTFNITEEIQFIKRHIIDLKDIRVVIEHREMIGNWLGVYLYKHSDNIRKTQEIALNHWNRYIIYDLYKRDIAIILIEYIRYISIEL